jgi:hypothetical protein
MAKGIAEARTGLFRATLLFGSIAAALSLIILPATDRHSREDADARVGVDQTATGSVRTPAELHTMRRTPLQPNQEPCLFFPDGTQRGAC